MLILTKVTPEGAAMPRYSLSPRIARLRRRAGIVVLTALDVEYQAMRHHVGEVHACRHPEGTLFECGTLVGTTCAVAITRTGPGNTTTALIAERAISMFRPQALLFVGIAGALRDELRLGDVVVSSKVYAFHGGRTEGCDFLPRPQVWEAPHSLEQLAGHVSRTGAWINFLPDNADPPRIHLKPIAGGEVLIDSRRGTVAEHLRLNYSDAVAVDMESVGVALAGHLNSSLPVLSIRGISDLADGRKAMADAAGWQAIGAAHAAAFAAALIAAILAETPVMEIK
jgi:adenosylhomocysteine nucleosidase